MSAVNATIPQPLNGTEIKKGIAVRMTQGLPDDVREPIREQIAAGLGKTCLLQLNVCYSEFVAVWKLAWRKSQTGTDVFFWVNYELGNYGQWTKGAIGSWPIDNMDGCEHCEGTINAKEPDGAPPDRFRRETDQPIPKPTELKPSDSEKSTFSRSIRGQGKRRQV